MLLSGMDVSGNSRDGNYKFLSVVLGTKDSINYLFNSIGKKKIHMKQIRDKEQRKRIIKIMSFDNKNRIAFCIRMDRKRIINNISNLRKVQQKRIPKSKILRVYNYLLFQFVKSEIEEFLYINGLSMTEVIFQCEKDCRSFTKDNSLHRTNIGIAYRMSDIVAWCNGHNISLKGVIEKNFTNELESKLAERLLR